MALESPRSLYDWAVIAIQLATLAAVVITAVIYYRQLRVMSRQLTAAQAANEAQNTLRIVEWLQNDGIRNSRKTVREVLSGKDYAQWTDDEKTQASHVAANYDVAAALLRSGFGSTTLIAANWKASICHCYQVLEPHIHNHRNSPNGDRGYWSNFEWLRNLARKTNTQGG